MEKIGAGYKEVGLFTDPVKIADTLPEEMHMSEMNEFQTGFLCGLLKEYRPEKILEVGVFAGGTSAVIMNCLHMLGLQSAFYSLDLNRTWELDSGETMEIGFVAQHVRNKLGYKNYTLITGDVLPAYIEDIGSGIDFLILDTTHHMPGEILEFLVSYPYLSENAIVVLHDVILNHYSESCEAYATRVLFDAVTAGKFYMPGNDSVDGLPNIAAFQLNGESGKHIRDVFSSLAYTWKYMPPEEQLRKYMRIIEKHYDRKMVDLLERIVSAQKRTVKEKEIKTEAGRFVLEKISTQLKKDSSAVVIYGCGHFGEIWLWFLQNNGINVTAFVVSDDQVITPERIRKFPVPVYHLKELPGKYKDHLFIPAVLDEKISDKLVQTLHDCGCKNILFGR